MTSIYRHPVMIRIVSALSSMAVTSCSVRRSVKVCYIMLRMSLSQSQRVIHTVLMKDVHLVPLQIIFLLRLIGTYYYFPPQHFCCCTFVMVATMNCCISVCFLLRTGLRWGSSDSGKDIEEHSDGCWSLMLGLAHLFLFCHC